MYAGFAGAVLAFMPANPHTPGVLVVTGLAALLLVIDDRWHIRAVIKFGMQLVVAVAAVAFGQDFWITFFGLPGNHVVVLATAVAVPVTVFWLLGMQNTVNFLDGVDGLAAGVVFIASGEGRRAKIVAGNWGVARIGRRRTALALDRADQVGGQRADA